MNDKKPLLVLTGPTAVGKTDLSISLAKAIGGEIISADSMQVYKHMDIGTAKIMPEEMQGVPHYLVDQLMPDDEFNVVIFQKMAREAIEQIYANHHIPIIVGGTGFYIQSILYDIDFTENQDDNEEYRNYLYNLAREKGEQYLHDMLFMVDPESAKAIHANNVKRVARALEYYHQTGECISKHNEEQQKNESPYNFLYFVLNNDRPVLYDRIDRRVDLMFEQGLEAEVKRLKDMGYQKDMVSMQGIGYKEMFPYLEGEYDLERAKYLIKLDTRHFAKRQITWFKREHTVTWMNYPDYDNSKDKILEEMLKKAKEKRII